MYEADDKRAQIVVTSWAKIYTYVNIWPFPDLANALIQTLLGNLIVTSDVSSEEYKSERVP